jgi:hypothetical protein
MSLRHAFILLTPLIAGCATQAPVAMPPLSPEPRPPAVVSVPATKVVETPYEVRAYRDPANPDVRHETHVVHRRTVVPVSRAEDLATAPRDLFPPASYAPLSKADELAAELATQRAITAAMRDAQAEVAELQHQMQEQYALLLRQSAEVMKTREQLEAERRRLATPAPAETTAPAAPAAKAETAEVKW